MRFEKDIDVLIVGYAGVDRIIRIDSPARAGRTAYVTNADSCKVSYGGNGSNVAACMGRLGRHVVPLMRVGPDWEELGYRKMLLDYGVDVSAIEIVEDETTSICHLVEDSQGNHLTMTYPGAMHARYAGRDMDDSLFKRAKYGLLTVATKPDVEQFLKKAKQHALPLVFGVRVDMESFPPELFTQALTQAQIIFMNEVEKEFIEDLFGFKPITALFEKGKARAIAVTLADKGSVVYEKTSDGIKTTTVPAIKCRGVADATGAGDSYIAGFLYGVLTGRRFADCAVYASTAASFVIEKWGCTAGAPTQKMLLERSGIS